ncbi:hypothetical protein GCM10009665_18170 [Kitasatospora nipponensis]|uniref:Uncharacterized protein n=1 Tax=Kitasatospora nipponensis TaxID=258049 RepID=A0ABP4GQL4_9ACTN
MRRAGRGAGPGSRNPARHNAALLIREPSALLPGPAACTSLCGTWHGWATTRKDVRIGVLKAQKDPGATLPGSLTP